MDVSNIARSAGPERVDLETRMPRGSELWAPASEPFKPAGDDNYSDSSARMGHCWGIATRRRGICPSRMMNSCHWRPFQNKSQRKNRRIRMNSCRHGKCMPTLADGAKQKESAMYSKFGRQGIFKIPEALRLGHDELRAELVRASSMSGPIGDAAARVASICLPHFEREEETVFPVFGLLRDVSVGSVRPEMAEVLPLVAAFGNWRDSLDDEHLTIAPAIHGLLLAAHKEDNREIVEFTYALRMHERLEGDVIFPTVLLIGNYVQERLGI